MIIAYSVQKSNTQCIHRSPYKKRPSPIQDSDVSIFHYTPAAARAFSFCLT